MKTYRNSLTSVIESIGIIDGHYLGPAYDAVPYVNPENPLDYSKPAITVNPDSRAIGKELLNN